jgi:hypothetical protein
VLPYRFVAFSIESTRGNMNLMMRFAGFGKKSGGDEGDKHSSSSITITLFLEFVAIITRSLFFVFLKCLIILRTFN